MRLQVYQTSAAKLLADVGCRAFMVVGGGIRAKEERKGQRRGDEEREGKREGGLRGIKWERT